MDKLIALTSGADWTDARLEHVVVDGALDLEEHKRLFKQTRKGFETFAEWLIERNLARKAMDDDVVEFWWDDNNWAKIPDLNGG